MSVPDLALVLIYIVLGFVCLLWCHHQTEQHFVSLEAQLMRIEALLQPPPRAQAPPPDEGT